VNPALIAVAFVISVLLLMGLAALSAYNGGGIG
jgi:hypothetical protein